jgi:hypothetical protein
MFQTLSVIRLIALLRNKSLLFCKKLLFDILSHNFKLTNVSINFKHSGSVKFDLAHGQTNVISQ